MDPPAMVASIGDIILDTFEGLRGHRIQPTLFYLSSAIGQGGSGTRTARSGSQRRKQGSRNPDNAPGDARP
jgi:hypothetical protein